MQEIGNWRHIYVDAQQMFAEDTPWYVPWMARVLPQLTEVSQRHAERTVFTRFVPPLRVQDARGSWKDYYEKWWMMTGETCQGSSWSWRRRSKGFCHRLGSMTK